jgi:hypothetical protein
MGLGALPPARSGAGSSVATVSGESASVSPDARALPEPVSNRADIPAPSDMSDISAQAGAAFL